MDFIKLEGIYALLAIIVICVSIIVGIIIILIILRKFKNIKITSGKFNVETNRVDSPNLTGANNTKNDIDTKISCFNRKCNAEKWANNVGKVIKIHSEMHRIDAKIIIEQMNYVEERLLILRETDLTAYKEELEKETNISQDIISHSDAYQSYINMLQIIYNEVKLRYRIACLENHFLTKSDSEWEEYKENKIDYIITNMNKDLEVVYTPSIVISYADLKARQKELLTKKMKNEFDDILDHCKKISKDAFDIMNDLELELSNLNKEICGIN